MEIDVLRKEDGTKFYGSGYCPINNVVIRNCKSVQVIKKETFSPSLGENIAKVVTNFFNWICQQFLRNEGEKKYCYDKQTDSLLAPANNIQVALLKGNLLTSLSKDNEAVWLHNCGNRMFFYEDTKVFVFNDVPHLIKLLRNHFIDSGFIINNKEVKKYVFFKSPVSPIQ
ncbi:Transposable element P transposase [Lucilia cuprina]|nr:Transposable element P transposase [Lucilia cuprina]